MLPVDISTRRPTKCNKINGENIERNTRKAEGGSRERERESEGKAIEKAKRKDDGTKRAPPTDFHKIENLNFKYDYLVVLCIQNVSAQYNPPFWCSVVAFRIHSHCVITLRSPCAERTNDSIPSFFLSFFFLASFCATFKTR